MSFAARAYPTTRSSLAPAYLSATINGDSNPQFKHVKIPEPLDFRSTSGPSLKLTDYPDGKYWRLSAGHTQSGVTRSIDLVFYTTPKTGNLSISADSAEVAVTYYSDPVNGALHSGVSGTVSLQYDPSENTLTGTASGLFDHGGEDGDKLFPISLEFLLNGIDLSRK
ncbi:MAG TPA: hypothetical protein VJ889_20885 [Pseudomonas sp.]|nr:hypothetical protein [Pseudomonas sp.]